MKVFLAARAHHQAQLARATPVSSAQQQHEAADQASPATETSVPLGNQDVLGGQVPPAAAAAPQQTPQREADNRQAQPVTAANQRC